MQSEKYKVVITVPIYKAEPSFIEKTSLHKLIQVLGKYPIALLAPAGLDINKYHALLKETDYQLISLEQSHFQDISAYSRLLISEYFYQLFSSYDYMLIYQLDAYVFRDELEVWVGKDYDYIGAPWIEQDWHVDSYYFAKSKLFEYEYTSAFSKNIYKLYLEFFELNNPQNLRVGNGGLSLRKISSFLKIASKVDPDIWPDNEDHFWGIYAKLKNPKFRIPGVDEALRFAFDDKPSLCYEMNGRQLPFACHGWHKQEPEFWANFISHES